MRSSTLLQCLTHAGNRLVQHGELLCGLLLLYLLLIAAAAGAARTSIYTVSTNHRVLCRRRDLRGGLRSLLHLTNRLLQFITSSPLSGVPRAHSLHFSPVLISLRYPSLASAA